MEIGDGRPMTTMQAEPARPAVPANNKALRDWIRALEGTAPIAAHPQRLLYHVIADLADAQGDQPALIAADSGERLTYRALIGRANRYAHWALDQGLAKGDTVCLMMPNRPDYLAIWLGLSSIGVVVALINIELRGHSLAHCIDIVTPKHLIIAAECAAQLQSATAQLMSRPKVWVHGESDGGFERIDQAIEHCAAEPPTSTARAFVTIADPALLIYTSGTTGLPKAANVSHRRLLQWSFWFAGLTNARPDDRMYDCLPMYHSVGGVVATGAMLVRGGAVLIRDRFSARHFWDDVCEGNCTIFQYIGELCRYLVNTPEHPRERAHRLRLCCGNGLQADIWKKFQDRFGVPRILEFYASTEGNVSLYNVEGKIGSIGRVPPFLASRFALALVQFDPATGRPARDQHGFCIRCGVNQTGEALGRIAGHGAPGGEIFEGYTEPKDTEQKILHNVFAQGDRWFRTGDLMRMDASGFYYFVDRVGDTFRWKGENVATSEVAAAIMAFAGITEANVYGVRVPGNEGAAGMAALVPDGTLDVAALRAHLVQRLPDYARPKFLRVAKALATTATFKHTKGDLQREGFDPAAIRDTLYFDDPKSDAFVPLDQALYDQIKAGVVRV
jgi:fatty-acyl-CoA synthase